MGGSGEVDGEDPGSLAVATVDLGGDAGFGPGVEEKRPDAGQFAAGVEESEQTLPCTFRSGAGIAGAGDDPVEHRVVKLAVQGDQQSGPVAEVHVERPLGVAGCRGDIGDGQ